MGIKNLNKYIINTCDESTAVKKIHIKELAGSKIAIDASIYIYRFLGENKLVEHMYLMTSIFRAYNIIPVFIFDGVPPAEKAATIQERKEQKQAAQEAFYTLKNQIVDGLDGDEKIEMEIEMERLKKQFIRIKDGDVVLVKDLLDKSGIAWLDAPGEADELCAYLSRTRKVDACMSEDMDMFAYGCPRILRNFSLLKQSIVSYDLFDILTRINMNMVEFRSVLALAGNDYNKDENTNLYEVIRWFREYKQAIILMDRDVPSFYDWIEENGFTIRDRAALDHVYEMFELKTEIDEAYHQYIVLKNNANMDDLRKILEPEGFVFANK
jgi:flap endonuclease-1